MQQQWVTQGLCFLKLVSSLCVLQQGMLLSPPQFTNSRLSCSKYLFIINSYFDNDVFYVCEIVLTYFKLYFELSQTNIAQISQFILDQLYNNWKAGKIEGSII